ncbi:MAG: flavodoxin family protein [Clostridiales Family XIII bacterium]|jgi:multimeric flavodoxin WrbA|nr:flavodoxin family protein [Clostridiales Family XIII bacterium]
MKVLGLVSSPRRLGNSELAVREILRCLPDEWEKRMIRLSDMNLIACKACYSCLAREDKSCILKDDMDFILRHMLRADKIVIAAPCYILGAHIGVQRLIDRLMPITENSLRFADKQCALVISYGLPGWEGLAREEMLKIPHIFGMEFAGAVTLEATLPGDSIRGRNLRRLQSLAEVLAERRPAETQESEEGVLLCPYCRSRLLTIKPDRTWRCVLCDVNGLVAVGEEGLALEKNPLCENRFSAERRIAHERRLQEAKQQFIERRAEIKLLQEDYADGDWLRPPGT